MSNVDVQLVAGRYGISEKSVANWIEKGVEAMRVWYEEAYGRQMPKKVRDRVREMAEDIAVNMLQGKDLFGEAVDAVDSGAVESDDSGGVDDELAEGDEKSEKSWNLEKFAEMLGLSTTVARVVIDEEWAHKEYLSARNRGEGVTAARKNWREATEAKRTIQKTDDAVDLAVAVLKEWVKRDWEETWINVKKGISAKTMGAEMREFLSDRELVQEWSDEDVKAYDDAWGKEIDRVLLDIDEN